MPETIFEEKIPEEVLDWYFSQLPDDRNNPRRDWGFVEFTSRSAGHGRKRRPRGVIMIKTPRGTTYSFRDTGKRPRHRASTPLDSLAQEALDDMPNDEKTVEKLIIVLRREKRK